MISHRYKCIFVHNPKAAGQSITKAFDGGDHPHEKMPEGTAVYQASTEVWLKTIAKHPNYFSFAVVRNPWDRFVSGCKFCNSTKDRPLEDILCNLPMPYTNSTGTNIDHDWFHITMTQHEFLYRDGKLIVDYLIRFENLQEGFDVVCDRIGKPRMKLPHENATDHYHYEKYFTPEALEMFNNHFQMDIRTFGYEF